MALTLRALLGEDVVQVGLGPLEAALARPPEALGGAPVGFQLSHFHSIWPVRVHVPEDGRCRRVLAGAPAVTHFFFGAITMTICRPSSCGICSTTPTSFRSSLTRA